MDVQIRSVAPGRGWAWIAGGFALFLRSPGQWLILLLILFALQKTLAAIPVQALAVLFWVLAVLLMPVFLAGLMDGCRSLEEGLALKVGHLAQGFRTNAANLVTIGGIYLIGNLAIYMIIRALSGESFAVLTTFAKNPGMTPQITDEIREAAATVTKALLISAGLSLPFLMAVLFAPALAYFDDLKPLQALKLSLIACLKNLLPMLVYGLVLFAGLMILMPIGAGTRQPDLGLWLLSPVLVPSIYASYRDIFRVSEASASQDAVQS